MAGYATTKLSSRGQVVIPEEVRNDLGLNEGDQFVVIGQGDAVILKLITPPKLEEFHELLSQARAEGKSRNQESIVEIRDCKSQAQLEVTIKAIAHGLIPFTTLCIHDLHPELNIDVIEFTPRRR